MLKPFKTLIAILPIVFLTACQSTPDVSLGSPSWQEWVESVVQSNDNQGHGPDIGSIEWCYTIDKLLFENQSGDEPCSKEWNIKVNNEISH